MSTRLDVSFLGRRPGLVVREASQIRAFKLRGFAADAICALLTVGLIWLAVILIFTL